VDADEMELNPQDELTEEQKESDSHDPNKILSLFNQLRTGVKTRTFEL
jgi:hypothetical protein